MNAAVDELLETSAAPPTLVPAAVMIDEPSIARAMHDAQQADRPVLEVLAETCGLAGDRYAQALASAFDYRFISSGELANLEPDFSVLPPGDATRRHCVVVHEGERLVAIFTDPFDQTLRGWLELRLSAPIEWALAGREELANLIARRAEALRAIDAVLPETEPGSKGEEGVDNLSYVRISEDTSPVVRLVHSTVYDALRAGASDIHLETIGSGLVVRYRLDGVLASIATVRGVETAEQIISRIKVMSELDIAERRVPQDGRFKIAINGRPIDFRVSIIPSIFGEDAVLRILDKQALTKMSGLRLDVLGFEWNIIEQLRRVSLLPYGMLLVTGPTGSGKTTTLYAAISETQTGRDKIITIEDPVEYQLPGVLQIPVNEKKGLTFARGLRSILRHDPDKIMVGEIRDSETAQIAVQAALNGILAQRLVRLNCSRCATPYRPPADLLARSGVDKRAAYTARFRRGLGCTHCRGTGYKGRRAIAETLAMSDRMRDLLGERAPISQIKAEARETGFVGLREAAQNAAMSGDTTLEEINRVTPVE